MIKLIATVFGIGYIKGGGTFASIFTCLLVYYVLPADFTMNPWLVIPAFALVMVLGVVSGNIVEKEWGKDSYRVVIDEVAGMLLTMFFMPCTALNLLIGLVLFRFFDMVKPLYIRKMEGLPGGLGVMMDDVLAGIYAAIVLQVIVQLLPASIS